MPCVDIFNHKFCRGASWFEREGHAEVIDEMLDDDDEWSSEDEDENMSVEGDDSGSEDAEEDDFDLDESFDLDWALQEAEQDNMLQDGYGDVEQPSADIHVDAQHSGPKVKVEIVTPV